MSSARSSSSEPQDNTKVKRKRKEATEEDLLDSDDNVDTPEEPVLSHAERRRRKKEQKLAANLKKEEEEEEEEEGNATKKRKLKDGSAKAVVPTKRQNSVWIGNMSFKTTQEDLRTFFGEVGEITRINMPTKRAAGPGLKPENRGYVQSMITVLEKKINGSYSLDLHMWILRLRKRRHWPLLYQKVPLQGAGYLSKMVRRHIISILTPD